MRIIRGKYGRRRFDVPRNISARPTTDFARENIFNVLENMEDFDGLSALDLFSGTGAIALEFLSRGCSRVVAVEMDVFKFIDTCTEKFDMIFADPPYDHPRFAEIPELILNSKMLKPGTLVIIEHNKTYDFSALPGFEQHRAYGSVNFSVFRIPEAEQSLSI